MHAGEMSSFASAQDTTNDKEDLEGTQGLDLDKPSRTTAFVVISQSISRKRVAVMDFFYSSLAGRPIRKTKLGVFEN